jgi:hypothetical protein
LPPTASKNSPKDEYPPSFPIVLVAVTAAPPAPTVTLTVESNAAAGKDIDTIGAAEPPETGLEAFAAGLIPLPPPPHSTTRTIAALVGFVQVPLDVKV